MNTLVLSLSVLDAGLAGASFMAPPLKRELQQDSPLLTKLAEIDDGDILMPPLVKDDVDEIAPSRTPVTTMTTTTTAETTTATTTTTAATADTKASASSGFSLKDIFHLAGGGAELLLPQLKSLLGPEIGPLLPTLTPFIPKLGPMIEQLVEGKTVDFSPLAELPSGLIKELTPIVLKATLGNALPADALHLLEGEAALLPQLTSLLPYVAPIFAQIANPKEGQDIGPMLSTLFTSPAFLKELYPLVPSIIKASPLGDEVPEGVWKIWGDLVPLMEELTRVVLSEIPNMKSFADGGADIISRLTRKVQPVIASIVEVTDMDTSEIFDDVSKLVTEAVHLGSQFVDVRSADDFKAAVFVNLPSILKFPTLLHKFMTSLANADANAGETEEEKAQREAMMADGAKHSDYLECADECKTRFPKDEFDCKKSPTKALHCLANCEDMYEDDNLGELVLVEDYQYCDKKSFMKFESLSGMCTEAPTGVVCKRYLSAMPDKYFSRTRPGFDETGLDGGVLNNEEDVDMKQGSASSVAASLITGAVVFLSALF